MTHIQLDTTYTKSMAQIRRGKTLVSRPEDQSRENWLQHNLQFKQMKKGTIIVRQVKKK